MLVKKEPAPGRARNSLPNLGQQAVVFLGGRMRSMFPASVLTAARSMPGPLLGLAAIVVVLSFLSPYFLTTRNIFNIVSQVSDIGIMAVGETLVILIGGIDLSVGSTMALSLMTMAWLFRFHGVPFPIAIVIGIVIGGGIGLINGLLVTYGRLQAFVATLATMSAAAGLALFITNGNTISEFPSWYLALSSNDVFGIPIQGIVLIGVFLLTGLWLRIRPGGRALYAVGGNEEVARLSGINVRAVKIRVYAIAGTLSAVAGALVVSRLNSAQPTAGAADLLNVIAVVVIGGASLAGGSGGMFGTLIGLSIIGVLNNGMSLLNISPNLQPAVMGLAIVVAVLTDRASARARA